MRNNKIKIVVDTNVFVNSMIFPEDNINDTKALAILLDLIENNKIELVFSQDTIGELIYILKNKIIHYIKTEEQLNYMEQIAILFFYSYSVNTDKITCQKCKDPKDDIFVECAVQGRADYILTNDRSSGMFEIIQYKFKTLDCEGFLSMWNDEINNEVAQD